MALDVTVAGVDGQVLARAARGEAWHVARGGLRRRVFQLLHEDADTQVDFTVDLEDDMWNARLNVARPDFYGRQAVEALSALARSAGGTLHLRDSDAPASSEHVLEQWRELNRQARRVFEQEGIAAGRTSRDDADHWWRWQRGLARRRSEAEPSDLWLPELMWFLEVSGGRALRVAVWAEGQAQAVPEADAFFYLPQVPDGGGSKSPILLVEAPFVRDALAPLLATTSFSDGVEVPHVPLEADAECRKKVADVVARHGVEIAEDEHEALDLSRVDDSMQTS